MKNIEKVEISKDSTFATSFPLRASREKLIARNIITKYISVHGGLFLVMSPLEHQYLNSGRFTVDISVTPRPPVLQPGNRSACVEYIMLWRHIYYDFILYSCKKLVNHDLNQLSEIQKTDYIGFKHIKRVRKVRQ